MRTDPKAAALRIIAAYDEWHAEREDLSIQEEHGEADSDDWHDSDDVAVDLLHEAVEALRRAVSRDGID